MPKSKPRSARVLCRWRVGFRHIIGCYCMFGETSHRSTARMLAERRSTTNFHKQFPSPNENQRRCDYCRNKIVLGQPTCARIKFTIIGIRKGCNLACLMRFLCQYAVIILRIELGSGEAAFADGRQETTGVELDCESWPRC